MQHSDARAAGNAAPKTAVFRPNVDIVNAQSEVLILADLPGVDAAGIEVKFERGVLELLAKVQPRGAGRGSLRQEYALGDYQRSFQVPEEFDGAQTSAEFRDGVLSLRIPKAAARSQRVPVRAGQG